MRIKCVKCKCFFIAHEQRETLSDGFSFHVNCPSKKVGYITAARGAVNTTKDVSLLNTSPADAIPANDWKTYAELKMKYTTDQCPFSHGTVYAGPFPGYVHGKNPAIDSAGCIPVLNPFPHECAEATFLREAFEYQVLYYKEQSSPPKAKEIRFREIESSIRSTGTYELTFDELQHGARVAWRNAPKCSNRSKWNELELLDMRIVGSNQEAFESILNMLEKSLTSMATKTYMTVFRQRLSGEKQGPRIWNTMLLRFAGYAGMGSEETGGILGDPMDVDFTRMLIDQFGWVPPTPRTAFDPLPLLIQVNENESPELFNIPSSYIPFVHIRHHDYPELDSLGLKWFPVPGS